MLKWSRWCPYTYWVLPYWKIKFCAQVSILLEYLCVHFLLGPFQIDSLFLINWLVGFLAIFKKEKKRIQTKKKKNCGSREFFSWFTRNNESIWNGLIASVHLYFPNENAWALAHDALCHNKKALGNLHSSHNENVRKSRFSKSRPWPLTYDHRTHPRYCQGPHLQPNFGFIHRTVQSGER